MSITQYTGYTGQVWLSALNALGQLQMVLESSTPPAATVTATEATYNTLLNGVEAIDAYGLSTAWATEIALLEQIEAIPLAIASGVEATFLARLSAYESAQLAVSKIVPFIMPPSQQSGMIASGIPLINDCNLLGFFSTFSFETVPAGLTSTNFIAMASGVAQAFSTIASLILTYYGPQNVTSAYDTCTREAACAAQAASLVNGYQNILAPALSVTNAWNQLATLPAMTMLADNINGAPWSFNNQQSGAARYAMLVIAMELAQYLLVLRQPQGKIEVATLQVNETLMDLAARQLGNFELWTAIATLNGLQPPYVGPIAGSGVAAWGQQLLLPGPGASAAQVGGVPSYTVNFLGTDIYLGQINGPMPDWTGDFQTVTGYNNLSYALGRRIQTTLGTLIYHNGYGSRLPPEIGAVLSSATLGHVAAYGKSALLADPRVQTVLSAVATLTGAASIQFQGSVQPGGFQSTPVGVDEVISPLP